MLFLLYCLAVGTFASVNLQEPISIVEGLFEARKEELVARLLVLDASMPITKRKIALYRLLMSSSHLDCDSVTQAEPFADDDADPMFLTVLGRFYSGVGNLLKDPSIPMDNLVQHESISVLINYAKLVDVPLSGSTTKFNVCHRLLESVNQTTKKLMTQTNSYAQLSQTISMYESLALEARHAADYSEHTTAVSDFVHKYFDPMGTDSSQPKPADLTKALIDWRTGALFRLSALEGIESGISQIFESAGGISVQKQRSEFTHLLTNIVAEVGIAVNNYAIVAFAIDCVHTKNDLCASNYKHDLSVIFEKYKPMLLASHIWTLTSGTILARINKLLFQTVMQPRENALLNVEKVLRGRKIKPANGLLRLVDE